MTRRLLVSYLTITLIVLLLLEIPLALFYSQREDEKFIADAERDAVVLASYYEDAVQEGDSPDLAFAEDFGAKTGARVILVDHDGISILDTVLKPGRDYSTRNEIEVALGGHRSGGIRHSDTLSQDLLYVSVPVASAGTVYGAVRLTVDAEDVNEGIHRFWLGLVGVGLVVLLAIGVIGWTIARSVTRPLRDLTAAANRFAEGDLTPSSGSEDAPAEIRELGETMNQMATRLDDQIEAQRAFVGDASHQLRTPLAALRLRLENLEAGLSDPQNRAEAAASLEETARLTELVNDLLRLARAEQTPALEAQDLRGIASDRIDTWSAVAESQGIALDLEAAQRPFVAMASPGTVEQVLDNLLDNAMKASSDDSAITVCLGERGGRIYLAVADQGIGLSDDDKVKALERFWSGSTTAPGSGLGLAIVRSLVRSSGGSLQLTDSGGGGLTVTVDFPAGR